MVSLRCCKWIWIPLIVLSVFALVESEKHQDRISRLSRRVQQRHPISDENHQDLASNYILPRKKRLSPVNSPEVTTTMTTQTLPFDNKKTLLDLEKPALFNDFDKRSDSEESANDTHIRVKRTDQKFVELDNPSSFMHLDNNYLEDLADSFPRGSSDEQRWSFEKRHIRLSKRSNDYEHSNASNYQSSAFNSKVTSSDPTIIKTNITDSMISTVHYNNEEDKSRTNFSKTSNPIDSDSNTDGFYKTRFKREKKSNKNFRRRVVHGKKRKLKKNAGKKNKKKGVSPKRAGKRLSNSSKVASTLKDKRKDRAIKDNLPNVIDDYEIGSRIEKRDSSAGGSKIDIAKRDISSDKLDVPVASEQRESLREGATNEEGAAVDETQRDKRSPLGNMSVPKKREIPSRISRVNFKREKSRSKRNGSNDLIVPKIPNESTSSSVFVSSESEIQIPAENPRGNRAVKSIEEIKELAEKLVTKVNELQNYLGYENPRGNRHGGKKKVESREIEVPRDNATRVEEEVILETPKLVDECVRIGDLSSALKTLDDRNVSTSKLGEATEKINLLNDQTGPLSKRMVRKSRIKRKSRRKWGRWTGWSSCSVTCGKGRQIRWRHCLRDCSTVETEMEEKTCQLPSCPPGKFLGIF
ncbi:hypothetical protein KPH14_007544 [Odynerus spinipes]|uniref:Uncharacterized protein n=1 Tax=Odynerus spinipes TaxID=1348599 RepID=A0AAD9RIT4_9HYME|nr:hypothetical protein KPH14_007544 [Odynerus spinipes]